MKATKPRAKMCPGCRYLAGHKGKHFHPGDDVVGYDPRKGKESLDPAKLAEALRLSKTLKKLLRMK